MASALPAGLAGQVADWTALCTDRDGTREGLPAVLAREHAATNTALREAAADAGFRRALSQGAPALLDDIGSWIQDPRRAPRPRKRLRIAKYLSRAAAKTSPYSTFMYVATGRWLSDDPSEAPPAGAPVVAVRRGSADPLGMLELDGGPLTALRTHLARHPELVGAAVVRINPSATYVGDSVSFLAASPSEPLITLRCSPAVTRCLRLLRDVRAPLTREKLVTALAPGRPAGGGKDAEGCAEADRLVGLLLAAGLLQADIPIDEHAVDVLGELSRWVRARAREDTGDLRELAELIEAVRAELRLDVPVPDVDRNRARHDRLRMAVNALTRHIDMAAGYDDRAASPTARHPAAGSPVAVPPAPIAHESALLLGEDAELSMARWRPALDDLDVLRCFLTVFDPNLSLRITLGQHAQERFSEGEEIGFLAFYRSVQEELAGDGDSVFHADLRRALVPLWPGVPATPAGGWRLKRLQELEQLRAQAGDALFGRVERDGIARAESAVLAELVARWPDWIVPPASVAWYVQVLSAGHESCRLVLNSVHGGHGRGLSRLLHLKRRAETGVPRAFPVKGTNNGILRGGVHAPTPAELSGLFGSTLNVRLPVVPYEIDYPYTTSSRPTAERIPLGELSVRLDPATEMPELLWAREGIRIVPHHLGMTAEFTLPRAARFLMRAFSPSYFVHSVAPPLSAVGSSRPAAPAEEASAVHEPRVEVGRVVLQRARWTVPGALVPSRGSGESDAVFMERIAAWLRREGIPSRVFVRAWHTPFRVDDIKSRKPMYIDFASPWLLALFERMTGPGRTVVLDEALPDPLTPPLCGAREAVVTEVLLEMSTGRSTGHA
ncbi:lantibiotic dehydratase [Actinomadura sp. NPDC000929]|uniref:lantibiotic dehydratase n=1 Tax=Actinomadura sp. NPDC000929 TaxID=3154517 RepID=UPI00339AD480